MVDFAAATTDWHPLKYLLLYGPCTGHRQAHKQADDPTQQQTAFSIVGSSTDDAFSITLLVYKHTALKSAHSQCGCFGPILIHFLLDRRVSKSDHAPHKMHDMQAYQSRYRNTLVPVV